MALCGEKNSVYIATQEGTGSELEYDKSCLIRDSDPELI